MKPNMESSTLSAGNPNVDLAESFFRAEIDGPLTVAHRDDRHVAIVEPAVDQPLAALGIVREGVACSATTSKMTPHHPPPHAIQNQVRQILLRRRRRQRKTARRVEGYHDGSADFLQRAANGRNCEWN